MNPRALLPSLLVTLAVHGVACTSTSPSPADVPPSDVTDVSDVTDALDVSDVTDVLDATDVTDALDVSDTPDALDASDAGDGCYLPGYGVCPRGTSCITGRCPDGTPVSCFCTSDGRPLCTGACPPPDASPGGCVLPDGNRCALGSTCEVGRCPDGTPITCHCAEGEHLLCTGACPPPPSDAGITCGEARSDATATSCGPADLVLDPAICRCILGWLWDGHQCVSSANCRCFGNCERLYPTPAACRAAYVHCG